MNRAEFKEQYRLARLIYGQHASIEHHKGPGFDCVSAANSWPRSRVEKYKSDKYRWAVSFPWLGDVHGFGGNQQPIAKTWKNYGQEIHLHHTLEYAELAEKIAARWPKMIEYCEADSMLTEQVIKYEEERKANRRFLFWEMFFAIVGIILILFYLEVSSR